MRVDDLAIVAFWMRSEVSTSLPLQRLTIKSPAGAHELERDELIVELGRAIAILAELIMQRRDLVDEIRGIAMSREQRRDLRAQARR